MGELIYWKTYDEPKKIVDAKTLKERYITGELICEHEAVERAFMCGGFSEPGSVELKSYTVLLMKNGDRVDFENDFDFSKATQYLQSVKLKTMTADEIKKPSDLIKALTIHIQKFGDGELTFYVRDKKGEEKEYLPPHSMMDLKLVWRSELLYSKVPQIPQCQFIFEFQSSTPNT